MDWVPLSDLEELREEDGLCELDRKEEGDFETSEESDATLETEEDAVIGADPVAGVFEKHEDFERVKIPLDDPCLVTDERKLSLNVRELDLVKLGDNDTDGDIVMEEVAEMEIDSV